MLILLGILIFRHDELDALILPAPVILIPRGRGGAFSFTAAENSDRGRASSLGWMDRRLAHRTLSVASPSLLRRSGLAGSAGLRSSVTTFAFGPRDRVPAGFGSVRCRHDVITRRDRRAVHCVRAPLRQDEPSSPLDGW